VVCFNCGLSAEEQIEKCPTWEDPVQLTGMDVVQVSDKDSRRNSRGSAKGFDKLTSSKVTKVPKSKCVDKC
jgi:hypothetical protein